MSQQSVEGYRISPIQRRIWTLLRSDAEGGYLVHAQVALEGPLRTDILSRAARAVIEHHEALRTTLSHLPGMSVPIQHVLDSVSVEIEELPAALLTVDGLHRGDNGSGSPHSQPVVKLEVARLGERSHLLDITVPAVCADTRSIHLIVEQIARVYGALEQGIGNPLGPALQYPDISEWLNEMSKAEEAAAGRRYWRQVGAKVTGNLAPLKRSVAGDFSRRAKSRWIDLGADTGREILLGEQTGKWEASEFLLTAWASVLRRLSYETNCIAVSFDGRSDDRLHDAVGPLTRDLPILLEADLQVSMRQMNDRVKAALRKAAKWQESFLWEDIEEEQQIGNELSHFIFSFGYASASESWAGQQLRFTILDVDGATDRFGLRLSGHSYGGELKVRLSWMPELFTDQEAATIAVSVATILKDAVARPAAAIEDLHIVDPTARRQLIEDNNRTWTDFSALRLVHEQISAQAARTPGAVATSYDGRQLTYGELEQRSDELAGYLRDLGVSPEVQVGICMERSLEMVVALLGVLKAGGAYVPLDPGYPADRLAYMLNDAQIAVLLTQEYLQGILPPSTVPVVCLDQAWDQIAARAAVRLESGANAGNTAYVLYTSGSTGTPKGVMIPHLGLQNHMAWMQREFPLNDTDRVLQKTAFSFDASVWEFYAPLLVGATLVMARPGGQQDAEYLVSCVRQEEITVLQLVPTQLEMVLEQPGLEACRSLRRVYCGGEALKQHLVDRFYERLPGAKLYNLYGPTEATIDATCGECGVGQDAGIASIGKPIANTQIYVLDEACQLAPVGVAGELYIGGSGLGRGYLNRPELTAERFVPNPYSHREGERLYRTGDVARWHAGGNLEYIERKDHQVKIRGFRIELGEIETALLKHPAVRQAAASVREDQPGNKRLVAYVVQRDGENAAKELREHLRRLLPEYMVPGVVVELKDLPLTPNGKVDRKALPAPEDENRSEVASPRTAVEEIVCGVFREILKRERIGVEESFFDLGGHSLLATQVISRLRAMFGIDLPLRALFEAPTVAGLANHVEIALGNPGKSQIPPMAPVSRDEPIPLSFAQQRLWFIDQLEPANNAYNIPLAVRLRGSLNMDALGSALEEIVRRHEVLRTSFPSVDGQPVQRVAPFEGLSMPIVDLSEVAGSEEVARVLAAKEAMTPFDLTTGPLLRAKVLQLAQQDHVLLVTLHHIVSDGWSTGVLVREFRVLYEAYAQGRPSPLPELAIQYGDFAHWQRQRLSGDVLEEQLTYWRGQLADAPVLEMPTDYPRPLVPSGRGDSQRIRLSAELTRRLEEFSREQGVTLFMTLLAGLQLLLARYTGQEDVVVGADIANRTHLETEPLIGFFVNFLVLRSRLETGANFRDLLAQVRQTVLEGYAHQDLPFERLVEELAPERRLGQTPLFQALLVLHNTPQEHLQMPGVELSAWDSGYTTAKFDLMLSLSPREGALEGTLGYAADVFSVDRMQRFVSHFVTLLERAVARPEALLWEIPLLSAIERRQVVEEWNRIEGEPPASCVHELFEEQASKTPSAVAVESGNEQLSYRELDQRANQLAHHLTKIGVGPEVRVALCMERGVEMAVAIVGVLKAGGAYVPLDPTYPVERLSYMLADSESAVLITQTSLLDRLPSSWTYVLCVDESQEEIARESTESPHVPLAPANLAYVIYTSGSTGQPKGTEIPHASIPGFFFGADYVNFNAQSVLLQHSSVSWDPLTLELWPALLRGGRCVLCPHQMITAATLREYVTRYGVNTLWLSSALFNSIIESDPQSLDGVEELMIGGEAVSVAHVRRALESQPALKIVNGYGPSECTVFSACYVVPRSLVAEARSVPIGQPIGDRRIYVLDSWMNPVPAGVTGEVFVGGPGVGRGYLKQAIMTAEKFVPDPFTAEPGFRLYRTGDLARWMNDGNLEFFGRADHQVKIRGFRIEPGEIEAVLNRMPGVKHALVMVREDTPGDKRLVAYVAAEPNCAGTIEGQLRASLREKMPEYMLPSAFVILDAFPLTHNGKVNRRALPQPEFLQSEGNDSQNGRTPVEEILAGVWCEVLKLESVCVGDSFFDLGGHSLMATQVISRTRAVFGIDLPLRVLFESPTIAGLAGHVERQLREGSMSEAPPVAPVSRDQPLPLSFAQQRLWFIGQLDPDSANWNIPLAVRLKGHLDVPAFRRALAEIVIRHEALRTRFEQIDGATVQSVEPSVELELPVEDLSGLSETEREEEVRKRAAAEAAKPFDLRRAPMLRAGVLKLADREHVLLLTMHHIASDGWSIGVLVSEVGALYNAFRNGESSPLAEMPIQYADYAVWQRDWLRGDVLEEQLTYWRQRLDGVQALELPTDHPRPSRVSYRGASEEIRLPAAMVKRLRALCRAEGATMFMPLLAAFHIVLGRWSGQQDVPVGTDVANRNRKELEGLIGFFVNQLVLRGDLSGNPTFRELLGRTREVCLGAYAHQDLPFERIVEELNPERSLQHSPLFQVKFVLQNAPLGEVELSDLELTPIGDADAGVKHDVTLFLSESGEELRGGLTYRPELYEAATIRRLLQHFERVLEQVAAEPGTRVDDLNLLDEDERKQVLIGWNQTQRPRRRDSCLHELFEEQAMRTPGGDAIRFGDETLSYSELNRRANQLAHFLRALGVGPEIRVGICLERSLEMVVGILGVLKAGGAFVPLDPEFPIGRLNWMIEDSQLPVLLTQKRLTAGLPATWCQVICLEELRARLEEESATDPEPLTGADNAAYVIYTSGSTGKSKGVVVQHGSVCNYLDWCLETYPLAQGSGSVLHTPLVFDLTVTSLWTPLLSGTAVHLLAPQSSALDLSAALAAEAGRGGYSLLKLTPAHLTLLAEGDLSCVRKGTAALVVGGEALASDVVRRWKQADPDVRVFNEYGPTEATVGCCVYEAGGSEGIWVPIGRPIANTQHYVLDVRMEPQPVGVPGELYIGGEGLARGYLNRPELTAERFVPDPFGESAGQRLYRTGDVAKWRPDGQIEYLGRIDEQVKIRGFRIEPGEIEALLRENAVVLDAVVVAREDHPGDKRLVAYLVLQEGANPGATELRGYLRERLPEYMVPAAFVILSKLPLTANGKLDRRSLPVPEAEERIVHRAPRTVVEELLAGIWSAVLTIDRVGREDNFFELGGHSLLATQVIARVRAALGVDLPLRAVFEAPTIEGLAARVELELRQGSKNNVPPLIPVSRDQQLPLSFAQQRLWFIDQLETGSSAYNVPFAIRLVGALDVEALERAIGDVVRRHEVLRTSFPSADGQPLQEIAPYDGFSLPLVDLANAADREGTALMLAEQEAKRHFDLARGPLLRVNLVRLSEQEHVLLVTLHHIISDGWSIGVLVQEFTALYKAFVEGHPSPLNELAIQYADFAHWQRQWLTGEALSEQLEYWKKQLADVTALDLPTDQPRAGLASDVGATLKWDLPEELTRELNTLSRREGVTLFMTLLAAFQVVLGRHSGQRDVVVGTPIAGRRWADTEGLIGFFVNTLVLRTELTEQEGFQDLLHRVREMTLEAYAHQDVPFERLVEELAPERDLGRTPLFQVMFGLENTPASELRLPGLRLSTLGVASETEKFDLTLDLAEIDGKIRGGLSYRTSLFHETGMRRLLDHFEKLLEEIVLDPKRAVSDLQLLSEAERHQLVVQWNQTEVAGSARLVHELFEARVSQAPEAAAVSFEGQDLTYEELNRRANQLARYLRTRGVGPEVRVGICMERSPEMVVGLLGVLKAGGAYVPLDPAYPADRLAYMLEDAGIPVLLVRQASSERFSFYSGDLVNLDSKWNDISGESQENLATEQNTENLAYVIYTSGSTGRPKGVLVEHRQVSNQLLWARDAHELTPEDRVLQKASFSFDASIIEIFLPLVTGARIVLAAPGGESDIDYLVQLMKSAAVTYVDLAPSLLERLLDCPIIRECAALRMVVSGAEVLKPELASLFHETLPSVWLSNTYGPTETTVQSTFALCRKDKGVSIGKPIANTQVYVLDEACQPAPVGVAGELYIGGAGLGRGYLNRPELTAERFVPNPYNERSGERLYRTGDLARWREDGNLDYAGRNDQQVKIRGFRIELGEIETALQGHAAVRQAVVVLRENQAGDKRLVAYFVANAGGEGVEIPALRSYLRDRLPDYMMPAAFVELERLPITPNGKMDRKRLPEPERREAEGEAGGGPQTLEEELLVRLWEGVLKQERVGVEENFFELGGHSLLATQLVSRVRQTFGVELPLRALFEAPTVRSLAKRVEQQRRSGSVRTVPALRRERGEGPLPLSFAQQRLWFIDQLEPGSAAYNMPLAVRLSGELNQEALRRSLDEIVRRHEVLRTRFPEQDGVAVQEIAGRVELEIAEQDLGQWAEEAREQEVRRWVGEEARQPFDLRSGPLLRVKLLKLSEREHVLMVTMHHIVSDGWSIGIMVREFGALYAAYSLGEAPGLKELDLQYGDYAVWQREWLQGAALEEQLGYWRKQLGGMGALELPVDYARRGGASAAGAGVGWWFSEELSRELNELSRRQGVTLFMTLLAGWQVVLSRHSGQADVAVGSPIAGRRWRETEELIGFFVNTLVLRTELDGQASFAELLGRVRETTLQAYEHQDVPFEKLVEELQPERDLSRTPFFQVMFGLGNTPASELRLPGLELRSVPGVGGTEKFELSLMASEQGGRIGGTLGYRTDLYRESSVQRLLSHWENVLRAAIVDPKRAVSELPMLGEAERRQVLEEWNRNERECGERCVHELIEEQAARTPAAVAVEHEGRTLSYEELNRRANQLARYLRAMGVGPEVKVGICMERSLEMMVGLLGVLKAGGAYVPLDPAYPADRLAYMLKDAQVAAVLSQKRIEGQLREFWGGQVILVDAEWERIALESGENLKAGVDAENLAYLIYTSGSTGRPKGVGIRHRSVSVLLQWAHRVFTEEETAGVLASTSICFDLSVYEIFVPLSRGGRVIVVKDVLELPALVGTETVTLVNTVPSAMTELLRIKGVPASVRVVNLAGETLFPALVRQVYEQEPITRLFNLYGPSEDTTYSTWALLKREEALDDIPIGKPLANTQVYVLDGSFEPVPVGVEGELYIGGDGLARGYENQPHLTAEKFIPNPFSDRGGERLYRTGDLARWRADGKLAFIGRRDHQLKIRGFRIELGEIEAALLEHPAVRQAVVVPAEDHDGDKYLVAAIVCEGAPLQSAELSGHLQRKLPAYMIPRDLVEIETLPLSPNGKVDRKRLKVQLLESRPAQSGEKVAPRDSLELVLRQLWIEVLDVSDVGMTDDFFRVGGHSLKAVVLSNRIARTFAKEIPVRLIFDRPTIADQAAFLRGEALLSIPGALVPIHRRGTRRPVFCVHPFFGLAHCYHALSNLLGPDQPFFGLQSHGLEEGQTPFTTILEMASFYIRAIRTVQPHGPYQLMGWSMGALIALEMAHQLKAGGEEISFLGIIEGQPPHSGGRGEPVSATHNSSPVATAGLGPSQPEDALPLVLEEESIAPYVNIAHHNLTADQLRRFIQVIAINRHAIDSYELQPYSGQITLFRTPLAEGQDHRYGWDRWVRGGIQVFEIPGTHDRFVSEPSVTLLAGALQSCLDD